MIVKRFSRNQLLRCTANLAAKVMGMEACSAAHGSNGLTPRSRRLLSELGEQLQQLEGQGS